MPKSLAVVQEACTRLGYTAGKVTPSEVRSNFNEYLRHLFVTTLVVLEEYEQAIDAEQVIPQVVQLLADDVQREREQMKREGDTTTAFQSAISRLLSGWHGLLRGLYLSIAQSRKQRGGKDFEYELQSLLTLGDIPFEVQSQKDRADFIFPSSDLLYKERPKAVLLTAKRTLRERWQEVVNELAAIQCPNTYLATAEEKIASNALSGIRARNIYVIVWDEVKSSRYQSEPFVVGYSKFLQDLTRHFLPQW